MLKSVSYFIISYYTSIAYTARPMWWIDDKATRFKMFPFVYGDVA